MKVFNKFMLTMLVLITFSAKGQKTDSVSVIFDNQKTMIAVPDFGYKTIIKMTDSAQVVEISVARQKPQDSLFYRQSFASEAKSPMHLKKVKWYSQIEAGYTIKTIAGPSSESIVVNGTEPATLHYNKDNQQGYRLGISIFEKERDISDKFSYVSGFKLGFAQSFRKAKDQSNGQDSVVHLYVGYDPITTTSIQFLFPFGFRQSFGPEKSESRIYFGTNIGSSIDLIKMKGVNGNFSFGGSPLILQPFLGFEKGKLGILINADFPFSSTYDVSTRQTVLKIDDGIGFSLTYRLF